MTKEFVTYEQAVALRDIGFDYGCLAQYGDTEEGIGFEIWNDENYHMWENSVGAPLKQQVLRFFREKYYYHIVITNTNGLGKSKGFGYEISIQDSNDVLADYGSIYHNEPWLETYEEAESACIDKLIEILKAKK